MTKRYYPITVGDTQYKLRLTMAGQRKLRQQEDEDILTYLLSAALDADKLCRLLEVCLDWEGSGNPITNGADFFDLLVDDGWQGQACFAALVFEIGRTSGLLTAEQAKQLSDAVEQSIDAAFEGLK